MISRWRAFPWSPTAAEGDPFSAAFVPAGQGYGRFDLPGESAGVRYLAETPDHAVAEKIVRLRNLSLEDADLFEFGFRLALVEVQLDDSLAAGIFDLCAATGLTRSGIAPDRTAFRDRVTTQAISQQIDHGGSVGLRWWSAFFGEWHTLVLFNQRIPPGNLSFCAPEPLTPDHPAVRDAADALGVT